jgi:hypothetical protein
VAGGAHVVELDVTDCADTAAGTVVVGHGLVVAKETVVFGICITVFTFPVTRFTVFIESVKITL